MNDLDYQKLGPLTHWGLYFTICSRIPIEVKPAFEFVWVTENLRHHEIKQAPQVHDVVLQRSASEQEPSTRFDLPCELDSERLGVLKLVSLVECTQVPIELFVSVDFRHVVKRLVCRDTHIELARLHLISENIFADPFSWDEINDSQFRRPAAKLFHPIRDRAFWRDYEMRLFANIFSLPKVTNKCDRLDSLAETHIVR